MKEPDLSRCETTADYIEAYRRLRGGDAEGTSPGRKAPRIALLAGSSINGLAETLAVRCRAAGVGIEVYTGAYNQYAQEILDPGSPLYAFAPDLVFLFVDSASLLGGLRFDAGEDGSPARRRWADGQTAFLLSLIAKFEEHSRAKIVLHNLEVPLRSPRGILESKQPFGLAESVETVNAALRDALKRDRQAYLFDYNAFTALIGADNAVDCRLYYAGGFTLAMRHYPALCDAYAAYIRPLAGRNRKCLVLDLDNTLWGGLAGEDGIGGIALGDTPLGRPFAEFQRYILALFRRGIILAVNSRNNPEDALRIMREHPGMVLKEEHFAAMRINWDDKAANLRGIAEELNIGLDSMVFIDDDERVRAGVRQALPEVLVVDLPEDHALYLKTISELNVFDALQETPEDTVRGRMYARQRERNEFRGRVSDVEEYLRQLETVVAMEPAGTLTVPRIAQLTQRTNQFNMTARRYTEEDVAALAGDPRCRCWAVGVRDRFGDQGHSGVVIIRESGGAWLIDSFLLSCRVLGRRVEDIVLGQLIAEAKKASIRELVGEYVRTDKNAPARGFYKEHSFALIRTEGEREIYALTLPE